MVNRILRVVGSLSLFAAVSLPFIATAFAEQEVSVELPPDSIAQWYKPQNKRQVWLHTMFGLRRSMQAIEEYVALEDGARLDKWSAQFLKKYRSIPEMVPEWHDEVELKWADRLEQAVIQREWSQVKSALTKLGMSCRSCHQDYRAVTAALYRAPGGFDQIVVEDGETLEKIAFKESMKNLSRSMNGFKIAYDDQRFETASNRLETFIQRVEDLGKSCDHCHNSETQYGQHFNARNGELLDALSSAVEKKSKQVGRKLGEVGVVICARCHGVHRIVSDLTGFIRS